MQREQVAKVTGEPAGTSDGTVKKQPVRKKASRSAATIPAPAAAA